MPCLVCKSPKDGERLQMRKATEGGKGKKGRSDIYTAGVSAPEQVQMLRSLWRV